MAEEKTLFVRTLEELATSRGIESLEELVERANAQGADLTVSGLVEDPPMGFGTSLDAVLKLDDAERRRLSRALVHTLWVFDSPHERAGAIIDSSPLLRGF